VCAVGKEAYASYYRALQNSVAFLYVVQLFIGVGRFKIYRFVVFRLLQIERICLLLLQI
jgi:hypothetical protein